MLKFKVSFKSICYLILIALLGLVIEQGLFVTIFSSSVIPHFIPIIILFIAFYWSGTMPIVIIWLLGLLVDFHIATLLGPAMIAALVVYSIFHLVAGKLFLNSFVVVFLAGLVACGLFLFLQNAVMFLFYPGHEYPTQSLLLDALITAILTPFIFMFLRKAFLIKAGI